MKPLYVRKVPSFSRRKQIIEEHFDASGEEDRNPRYNIAPTQPVPVIRQHPKEPRRVFSFMRWGLIPSWAKDASGAAKDDQCKIGNCTCPAGFSGFDEVPQMSDSGRRILRVGANRESEATVLLRSA